MNRHSETAPVLEPKNSEENNTLVDDEDNQELYAGDCQDNHANCKPIDSEEPEVKTHSRKFPKMSREDAEVLTNCIRCEVKKKLKKFIKSANRAQEDEIERIVHDRISEFLNPNIIDDDDNGDAAFELNEFVDRLKTADERLRNVETKVPDLLHEFRRSLKELKESHMNK